MKEKRGANTTGLQFSLRTLMLAVNLAAVTLSSVAVFGTPVAVSLTLYFLLLLTVRIKWGCEPGFSIAIMVTGFLAGCPFVFLALRVSSDFLSLALVAFIPGLVAGFYCFLLVHVIVCFWEGEPFELHQIPARPGDDDADRPTDDVSGSPER